MRTSVKMALAASVVAAGGAVFLVGSSYAERGFGMMGHGPGGHGGPMVREMLASVDTNGDSALSQEEIDAAVDARFAEFDADNSGGLSLTEFDGLWAEITRPMAVRAFQFLDPNGDADVARTEIDERFGSVVARFDSNEDGVLDASDRPHRRGWGHGPRGRWMGGDRDGQQNDE
jgi:hypothetical protein